LKTSYSYDTRNRSNKSVSTHIRKKSIQCGGAEAWLSLQLHIKLLGPTTLRTQVKKHLLDLDEQIWSSLSRHMLRTLRMFCVFGFSVFIWSLLLLHLFSKHRLITHH